jgi:drug/metabolite transporter (DMT)-like permease
MLTANGPPACAELRANGGYRQKQSFRRYTKTWENVTSLRCRDAFLASQGGPQINNLRNILPLLIRWSAVRIRHDLPNSQGPSFCSGIFRSCCREFDAGAAFPRSAADDNCAVKLAVLHPAVLSALAAAALFGASTPFAKQLVGGLPTLLLAGLLYLGSGIGLIAIRLIRDRGWKTPGLRAGDWSWLLGAIVLGGAVGPALLMFGLARTTASAASLLLNLEAVLTALLAWVVFRENADRRIVLGMFLIVAGGVVLAWPSAAWPNSDWLGSVAVAGACLCWAIDNNLTRKVAASDALFLSALKGLAAGSVNTLLFLLFARTAPTWSAAPLAMLVGLLGYGVSLVLFILALRGLGAARTGAYFSTAPFIGAAIAITAFGEPVTPAFVVAAGLMGLGVWLHLTERHDHEHVHEPVEHTHPHVHDAHHRHPHAFPWNGQEPHTHPHRHEAMTHRHPHYPDIHHTHFH